MASFTWCLTTLLGKMLYVDDTVMIAPIDINDNDDKHFIKTKTDIPSNFTKLGKHIMISGGSWVFNKKEKGSNDVYGRFRLKSQIPTEDMISRVSFEFSRVGGKYLFFKKTASSDGDRDACNAPIRLQWHGPQQHPQQHTSDARLGLRQHRNKRDDAGGI